MHCCNDGDPSAPAITAPATQHWLRRIAAVIEWAVPITTLALIPKCPACVAAYVLLFTGVGLSFSGAAAVRWGVIALSIAALGYLLYRTARRVLASPA